MRVLLSSVSYAPEETGIAPYASAFAEYLAEQGNQVTVLTARPSYPYWRVFDGYRRRVWSREQIRDVKVLRRWHWVPSQPTTFRRGLSEASYLATGASALLLPNFDVVVGIVPSAIDGFLASVLAQRFRCPYAIVIQDLVSKGAEQTSGAGARVAAAVRLLERRAVVRAGAVGIIAEGFRAHLEQLGVAPDRIHRLRNWTHIGGPVGDLGDTRDSLGLPRDRVICLHAGNMGAKQGLETVIRCARLAQDAGDRRLLFVLMGDGNQRRQLERLASAERVDNVRFIPPQPANVYPSALAAADLLLLNQQRAVTDMALPSKLTSYFASGRPVVAAVASASECAREIALAGAGVMVPPEQPEALLSALVALAADRDEQQRMGANGRSYAHETLAPEPALRAMHSLVERLHSRRTAPSPISEQAVAG